MLVKQSFLSWLRELEPEAASGKGIPPPRQSGTAQLQLAVIAILEDARLIFSPMAFWHIAGFLEGFTEVSLSTRNTEDLRDHAADPDSPCEERQVERESILQTTVVIAQRQGNLDSGKQSLVHSGRSSLVRYHLLDRNGRTIARVNREVLKAWLRNGKPDH